MSELFRGERPAYKPFNYPWAFSYYELQNKRHWLPSEVSLNNDCSQWHAELTDKEKHILTQTQLYLANADSDVASAYCDKYLPNLKYPEVRQMLLSFAAMEAIHQHSYSLTFDQLGFSESQYGDFLKIPEMREKHEFITRQRTENLTDIQKFLLDIAICSAFGEGVQLFSAFVILLSFQERGLMNGLGTLTGFIARDEDLHCRGMLEIFNTIVQEHPEAMTPELVTEIGSAAVKAYLLEEHFIELVFSLGELPNLEKDNVKKYIKLLLDKRLLMMDKNPLFHTAEDLELNYDILNPFPWMNDILNGNVHENFFEVRPTSYNKSNFTGNWEDAWSHQYSKI